MIRFCAHVILLILLLVRMYAGSEDSCCFDYKSYLKHLASQGVTVSQEKRLIKELLERYDRIGIYGRPVGNKSMTINVEYGIGLIQILDLDEKDQVLTTNIWCRYKWVDILLQWDPKEYGDVQTVRVPAEKIWKPDIVLYNYADERLKEHREAMAVIQHTGEVLWIPMAIFKSVCQIDITHFPFDEQECFMKFGSWTYDGYHLDINFLDGKKRIELNDYMKSHEWKILAAPAIKNIKRYPCCDEPYPDLTFRVKLKRKVAFYNYILILPCVLLSTLTLVLFWLPPESPAKMVLGMNIFVAFFLLLLLLADSTPPAASKIPLIGAYYCLNMIMITLSTFLSVIVINLYFRGDRKNRVPRWLKKIMVDGIARILCMRSEVTTDTEPLSARGQAPNRRKNMNKQQSSEQHLNEMKYNKFKMTDAYKEIQMMSNHTNALPSSARSTGAVSAHMPQYGDDPSPDKSPLHFNQGVENDIREIRRALRTLMGRITDKDAVGRIAMEWRLVALVLDRLFFFMYLTAIIISLATIFPKTPSTETAIEDLEESGLGGT